MSTREDAREFLQELRSCRAKSFFSKIDESQRGVGFALAYLEKADGEVIAGDLARELDVSTARIAALLRTMEKNGLIKRRTSAEDARRTVVEITPEGVRCVNEMKEQILNITELLVDKVGKEDLKGFVRISRKIKNALEE